MKTATKRRLVSLAQLAFGMGLLGLIVSGMRDKGDLFQALRDAAAHWPLLGTGILCFLACLIVSAVRWKILMDARDLVLPLRRVLALNFLGHFFNSFLFGATGGDLVKAWYASRELPRKKTEAVATVFIDRVVGLVGLVLVAVTIMMWRLNFFLAMPETRTALIFNLALLGTAVLAFFIVFRRNLLKRWSFFRRLEQRTSLGRIAGRAYTTFHLCLNDPAVVVKTIALSMANHLILVTCAFYFGAAIEIGLPYRDYLTVFPVINAVAGIPLTPGGLGTREAAAKFLLGALGVPGTRAVMVSLLLYATMLTWSLVGGIVYLFYVYNQGQKPPPDPASLQR